MSQSEKPEPLTLKRWSQRKLAASRESSAPAQPPIAPAIPTAPLAEPSAKEAPAAGALPELPPLESLTPDSDFTPFFRPGVDEGVKRGALKKLFSDPRFNAMDGLDVYIDDYSKPDPLPAAVAATLAHARYVFDPPKTRVTPEGFVEDVPPDEPQADEAAQSAREPVEPDDGEAPRPPNDATEAPTP
jgi:hypothetical protein